MDRLPQQGDLEPRALDTNATSFSARFERALKSWEAGDFLRCLRVLDEFPLDRHWSDSILLRARALMRAQRLTEAQAWLQLTSARHDNDDAIATNAMLLGTLCSQFGEYAKAESFFVVVSATSPHHTIVAECCYRRALAAYLAGDMAAASRFAAGGLRPTEDIVYARTRSLLGWIAVASADYVTAYAEFCGSLEALDHCRAGDVHLRASMVYALAILAAETHHGDAAAIDAEIARTPWTASLADCRAQSVRHAGLAYEYAGDYHTAMHRFMTAATIAPGTAWAIYGYVACANLALRLGQHESAEAFALNAVAVAESISETAGWDSLLHEQRVSLLELAHLSARLGRAGQAEQYYGVYNRKRELGVMSSLRHDSRLETLELQVGALVHNACGEKRVAQDMLEAARAEWARLGYVRRVSDAVEDLCRISGFKPASLGDRPASVSSSSLSLRDRSILQMVLAGRKNAEIATSLNISPKTVKNRIGAIYQSFGVHTRADLVLLFLRDAAAPKAALDFA